MRCRRWVWGVALVSFLVATSTVLVSGTGPTITTTSLPNAQINLPYSPQQLVASGGISPLSWTISSGSLPRGLNLSPGGLLSGTPTGTTETFTVEVTDAGSHIATQSLMLTVAAVSSVAVTLSNSTLTPGATEQATATATYSDGTSANVSTGTTAAAANWVHIQGAHGFNANTGTTASATLTNVGLGHIVVCGVITSSGNNDTIANVKDSNNNTYTKSPSSPTAFLNPVGAEAIYYNLAPPAGATSVTVTWNQAEQADSYEIFCDQFNPTGGTVLLDHDSVNASGGPGTAINSPSITPSAANELLYAAGNPRFAITAVNNSWSVGGGGIADGTSSEYILNSGTATAVSWTANQSGAWSAIAMALSLAPTSAGPGTVWSEMDDTGSGVATVSPFGLVTANSTGTASFKACIGVICGISPTLTVSPPTSGSGPTIVTTSLPQAQADVPYPQQQLAASGGTSPYSWAVSSGLLPSGLHLSASGLISGTATGTTQTFTVKVTDAGSNTATQSFTLTVVPLSSVSVSLAQNTIAQGASTQATCTATYSDNSTSDCSSGSALQIFLVNSDSGVNNSGSSVASVSTAGVATATGNLLFAACRAGFNPASFTVTDTAGDAFTPIGSISPFTTSTDSSVRAGQAFYARSITANAANKVTCATSSSGPYQDIAVVQWAGLNAAAPLDVHSASAFANSNSVASPALTTGGPNEIIVQGGGLAHGFRTFAPGAGYTLDVVNSVERLAMQHQFLLSAQTTAPNMTFSGATEGGISLVAAFKAAANAGTNWSSGTPATALVSGSGLVTGVLGPGVSVIQACLGSVCGSATVAVNGSSATLQSIAVTPANPSIIDGATESFTATGTYSNNTTQNITTAVSWTSSNTSVAAVSNTSGSNGLATSAGVGSTTIQASLGGVNGSANLTVTTAGTGFAGVFTEHNDNGRTGQDLNETILTTSNVNVNQFGKLFSQPVDGQLYAQPLYAPNVAIAGKGTHNVVIVASENDSVYAFDADNNSGGNASPLWHASLVDTAHGATAGEIPVNASLTGCTAPTPIIGITSTPVIDPSSGTIYVEAKSVIGNTYIHRIHALDIATGNEKAFGPTVITATVNGTGDGSFGGQLVFGGPNDHFGLSQMNRPGLLLVNGTVYIGYASHCDNPPFHGWLFAYDAATLNQKSVFVTTPNGSDGGIWMSGSGLAADASGSIYLASGNGTFGQGSPLELGDTIARFSSSNGVLSLSDYFTPFDQNTLDVDDDDLGSGGVLLLPDQPGPHQHLLVAAGKAMRIYLVDRDQMTSNNTHYCSGCSSDPEIVQENLLSVIGRMYGSPAYWNNNVYFWGVSDVLRSIPLVSGQLDFNHITSSTTSVGFPGPTPSISANGSSNGIVWSIDSSQADVGGRAVVHANDATNVANELWNSSQAANSRDLAGTAVKFAVPTIANGKVYVGAEAEVDVYGLLP